MKYLREDLKKQWQGKDVFSIVQKNQGDIFRHKEGRRTLRFDLDQKSYFFKLHENVNGKKILKNLIPFRKLIFSISNQ